FVESGLPYGTSWSVTYNGVTKSSTSSLITFNATSTPQSFSVPRINTSTCNYAPSPSAGSVAGGSIQIVSFTCSTVISTGSSTTVTFVESGLPYGTSWSVTYNGVTKSSTSSLITFNATSTPQSFSVPQVTNPFVYNPSPSSGSVAGGSIQIVSFTLPVINITNTQNVATPYPFQQMINVSSSSPIWPYINTNQTSAFGQNVEFIYPGGLVIPSWLESYSTTHAIWWVKILSIPANSSIIIYAKIAPKSTNLFNSKTTGEAPQLSPTYAEYDDGANVFTFYDNFAGKSLNTSKWVANGANYSVSDGLTYRTNPFETLLLSKTSFTEPYVIDWYGYATAGSYGGLYFDAQADTANSNANLWEQEGSNPYSSDRLLQIIPGVVTVLYCLWGSTINGNYNVYTLLAGNTTVSIQVNYNTQLTEYTLQASCSDSLTYSLGYSAYTSGYFGPAQTTGGDVEFWQWVRVRAYPPNGVMPKVSIG
ncbi:MAG: DUF2341 domain-containing protein, partial [Conexivisphaerales archaeon]